MSSSPCATTERLQNGMSTICLSRQARRKCRCQPKQPNFYTHSDHHACRTDAYCAVTSLPFTPPDCQTYGVPSARSDNQVLPKRPELNSSIERSILAWVSRLASTPESTSQSSRERHHMPGQALAGKLRGAAAFLASVQVNPLPPLTISR